MTWRDRAKRVIRDVLAAMPDADLKQRRAALREAYPFGPRQHHPYKIWCDEVARQLGTKKPKATRYDRELRKTVPVVDPRQWGLF